MFNNKKKPFYHGILDAIAPEPKKSHTKQYVGVGLAATGLAVVAGVVANKDRGPS